MSKPSYSTKECHVAVYDEAAGSSIESVYLKKITPISKKSKDLLRKAVRDALERYSLNKDVLIVASLGGYVHWPDDVFVAFVDNLRSLNAAERVACATTDCIVLVNSEGFTVTLRILGAKKFFFEGVPDDDSENSEDSFEMDPNLHSQQVNIVSSFHNMHSTPKRK
ncbi:hypothetical protein SEMRO_1341_G264470.1 [Seminavis robusta]|uniref:Uncharacterized protein n=1 Tax=Seminavis robusta TaxID=568900 RepID=A0A9N8HRN8_9STRA|nr:hypothetical protein SEMRO_1341_G264470.1 [Seminavis robusta]|eukprot:Sro1341_g264470.1 n/a (166) ;mRNA; r:15568-16065